MLWGSECSTACGGGVGNLILSSGPFWDAGAGNGEEQEDGAKCARLTCVGT